jgi:hypothetical protein
MPFCTLPEPAVTSLPEESCPCVACRWEHGARHPARPGRYTSDLTDAQWQVLAPLLPWPAWLDGGGRPEEHCCVVVVARSSATGSSSAVPGPRPGTCSLPGDS